jgi:hypothetical protein
MQNLFQLGVRDADLPAPDRRRMSDGGMLERTAKRVSTDHPSRAHDYNACLPCRGNVHLPTLLSVPRFTFLSLI